MKHSRDYEQKKALVSKWFTVQELEELQVLNGKPVLIRVDNYSSDNLYTSIAYALLGIADEKENMMESLNELLETLSCNNTISILLDSLSESVSSVLCEEGSVPEEITLTRAQLYTVLDRSYTIPVLVKALLGFQSSADRIAFFERKIKAAKIGITD